MKIKSRVSSFGSGRKMVELPKAIRDNFSLNEAVIITKSVAKPSKKRVAVMDIG
jgi:hypothetical protein